MGLFSSFFSPSSKYSPVEHPLTAPQVKRLITHSSIQTLDQKQELLVEETILARRRGDGKISLRQIDEVLRALRNQKKVSPYDYKGIMKVMELFFSATFEQRETDEQGTAKE